MKYQFINDHRSRFGVEKMCHAFKISRSGFYSWGQRPESKRSAQNRLLLENIQNIYKRVKGRYGSPRITAELRDLGYYCSRPRVARLMQKHAIRAITRRKFKVTTNANHKYPFAPNLLNQQFYIDAPNRVWVSDLTYIHTWEGWLYLTVVLDLYNRKIIGWSMSKNMLAVDTAIKAFKMALMSCRPSAGLVFHSDRGIQYACDQFVEVAQGARAIQSMSGSGNCYDNAVAESFFGTLKRELVHHELYRTRDQARRSLFAYIEGFYNRVRKHSYLGYKTPDEYGIINYKQAI